MVKTERYKTILCHISCFPQLINTILDTKLTDLNSACNVTNTTNKLNIATTKNVISNHDLRNNRLFLEL